MALRGAWRPRVSHAAALTYSNIVFAGVILIWLFNTLASIIRALVTPSFRP
jgi:hypothetical protein